MKPRIPGNSESEPPRLRICRYTLLVAGVWTATLVGLAAWNISEQKKSSMALAGAQTDAVAGRDRFYRQWNADLGGVYAAVTEQTPPNPYLATIPERDISTPSGRKLTLMNPAYMTRLVNELATQHGQPPGHLTSLNPRRPENGPDAWEAGALRSLNEDRTLKRIVAVDDTGDKPRMRTMLPFPVEQSCLKCHADQGYKIGDLRGGIAVSVPLEPFRATAAGGMLVTAVSYGTALLLGLGGLLAGSRKIARHVLRQNEAIVLAETAQADLAGANHRLQEEMTVRRRSEQALREREEDLSITLHSIGDAVIATDTDGRVVRMNPVAEQLTGWPLAEAADKPLAEIFRIVNARTREPVPDPLAKALVTGEVVALANDTVLIARDGAERQIADSAAPIRDAQGRIRGAVLVFHDVTAEYKVKTVLRERVRELTCLQHVRDGLQPGLSVEQLCQHTVEELIPGMGYPQSAAALITLGDQRFTSGRSVEGLTRGLHADIVVAGNACGRLSVFYIEDKPFCLPEEQNLVDAVAKILSHWLERLKAEEALQESNKRFMDILYASNDAILIIDGDKFVDCNEATARMLGYSSRDRLLMTHPSQLSPSIQPDGRDSFEKANEMMQTAFKQGFHRFEWSHRRANGEDFPVEVSLTPINYQGKTVLHCLWRDISEQKKVNEMLVRERQNLKIIFDSSPMGLLLIDENTAVNGPPINSRAPAEATATPA